MCSANVLDCVSTHLPYTAEFVDRAMELGAMDDQAADQWTGQVSRAPEASRHELMARLLRPMTLERARLETLSVRELNLKCAGRRVDTAGYTEKENLVVALLATMHRMSPEERAEVLAWRPLCARLVLAAALA